MRLDDISHMRVTLVAAKDTDGCSALGACIVSHIKNRAYL
jgi:hypothetical protein